MVSVPPGLRAGDVMHVEMPSGQVIDVKVPPGLAEGDKFQVGATPQAPVTASSTFVSGTELARGHIGGIRFMLFYWAFYLSLTANGNDSSRTPSPLR